MKTQKPAVAYVAPYNKTVTIDGKIRLIVHTGTVKVVSTKKRFHARRVRFVAVGPYYTTATVELPDGTMEAITDTRVSQSVFAAGWR